MMSQRMIPPKMLTRVAWTWYQRKNQEAANWELSFEFCYELCRVLNLSFKNEIDLYKNRYVSKTQIFHLNIFKRAPF